MNHAIIFAVYVLGALTVCSFLVFLVLLVRYLKTTGAVVVPPPSPAPTTDQLHALDVTKVFDSIRKALEATAALAKTLNDARPVAIAALLTILFLVGWLFSLTLLIVQAAP
jgi:Na+-transporting methylmalonyl-CoA/oxaloacetate decarboxylase gamma subunit